MQKIAKVKLVNQYNCEGINYPSKKIHGKKFAKSNVTIVLNILHAKKKKYIMPIFQNIIETVRKQVILLIISNGERWHYLEVKIYQHYLEEQCQSTWITFIVLIAFTFFVTGNKNELHKKVCKNKTFVKL